MKNLVISFFISFAVIALMLRYAHLHEKFSSDNDFNSAQKIHTTAVPRIGGFAIFFACLLTSILHFFSTPATNSWMTALLICAIPAFASGLIEDLTKQVSPWIRLICIALSALLAYFILQIHITHIHIPFIDKILLYPVISVSFSMIAITALTNAINIIDGFNGLASMVSIMMYLSMAYIAFLMHDTLILTLCLIMVGAILGFFIWNFPRGLIFLGDGGAYFIGFILSVLSITLTMNHPQISAWYPVLLFIYPIFETCFSVYRRLVIRKTSPSISDGVHLHMLLYKRITRWTSEQKAAAKKNRSNSVTSLYLWLLSLLSIIPATLLWQQTTPLIIGVLLFSALYIWLYSSIVRFKTPTILKPFRKKS